MKKLMMTTAAFVLAGSAAFAQAAPEHFRNLDCDPAGLKPILASDGVTVLYWTNIVGWSGCTADTGRGPEEEEEVEEETPVAVPPVDEPPTEEPPTDDGDNGHGNDEDGVDDSNPGESTGVKPPKRPKRPNWFDFASARW